MIGKKEYGFTIIELMVAVFIIAVIASFAVPAITRWLPDYRLKSAARTLVSNFQKAKLEAVKRNVNVVLDFAPGAYLPAGESGSYMVFADDGSGGGGGTVNDNWYNGTEPVVIRRITMPKNVSLYSTSYAGNKTNFNPRGLPSHGAATEVVQMRNSKSRFYRSSVSPVGSIRLQASNDGTAASWN